MKILQTYSIREDIFGEQEFNVLVSDDYAELFNAANIDITTDIFQVESSKKDLDLNIHAFGIDELQFSIRETSIQNEDDKNAMFFCLDATNTKVPRFIAVYIGAIEDSNLEFVGKIESGFDGDDIVQNRNEWSEHLGVKREYKFTALSIDLALLEQAEFTEVIRDSENVIISNVYDRIKDDDYSILNDISESSLCYPIQFSPSDYLMKSHYDNHKQVNIFDAINMYLGTANEILTALYGLEVEFSFGNSSLGFSANPTKFELEISSGHIKNISADVTKNYKVKLTADEYNYNDGDPYVSLFVSRTIIDPEITKGLYPSLQKNEGDEEEFMDYGTQNLYSWKKKYKNVAELLYNLARNFGCYIMKTMTSTSIQLEFVPRQDINLNNNIRILGAKSGSISTKALEKSENVEFKEFANHLMTSNNVDVFNSVKVEYDHRDNVQARTLNKLIQSNLFIPEIERLKKLKDENFKIYDLPLSLSTSTIIDVDRKFLHSGTTTFGYSGKMTMLFNTARRVRSVSEPEEATDLYFNGFYNRNIYERLHTGIFMYCTLPEYLDYSIGGGDFLTTKRPVRQINLKVGDENLTFTNFSEYLKYIEEVEKKQYETTYTLKVPFWNAFAEDGDGLNPSWKLAKLGTNVRLSEYVVRYIEEEFNESLIENDFTIVSIERNLTSPETTIKLNLKSRFAYGYNDEEVLAENGKAGPILLEDEEGYSEIITTYKDDSTNFRTYVIEDSETIEVGDAVSLLSNGKIVKTQSDSDQDAEILGLCVFVSDEDDNTARILISGIAKKEGWSWAGVGDYVYARTNPSTSNLTQTMLEAPNTTEDLVVFLGKTINEKEIEISKMQWKYEDGKTT